MSTDTKPGADGLDGTTELHLHPFNSPAQALWLCGILKESLGAHILSAAGTPEGAIIKVFLRNPASLVDFLAEMTEVAEVWEETAPQMGTSGSSPEHMASDGDEVSEKPSKMIYVALKPP